MDECIFCGSTNLGGVGSVTVHCHDCGSTWDDDGDDDFDGDDDDYYESQERNW